MRKINVFTALFLFLALVRPAPAESGQSAEKIRIGFPSLAFSYMPFYVAQEKGLLKKVGLEAEYIQMRTGIQPQAVINGNINFFPSVSTGISAAVSGIRTSPHWFLQAALKKWEIPEKEVSLISTGGTSSSFAALLEAVAWLRANRAESAKIIADKFKVTLVEAERTYETMTGMFTRDGRLDPRVARGYVDVLRQERPVPADFDVQKILDFSLLPAPR
jgi:ABC-type nitrate/sulfonate/bicarbonate transport system substrate-binding protein